MLKHPAFSEQSYNNSNFNMINLIKDQQNTETRKTLESFSSNGIEEVIESVIEGASKPTKKDNIPKSSSNGISELKIEQEASLKKSYLMQPPDSETIAAATEKHKLNRTRRRTRTKYDDKQVKYFLN